MLDFWAWACSKNFEQSSPWGHVFLKEFKKPNGPPNLLCNKSYPMKKLTSVQHKNRARLKKREEKKARSPAALSGQNHVF